VNARTRSILASRHLPVLRRLARSHVLLAFDYDGTLTPIAPTPERARMPLRTRRLLAALADRYPCAVISGRALDDVAARLAGVRIAFLFGNHGVERQGAASPPDPRVRRWAAALHKALKGRPGIRLEDKRHTLALHFRSASNHQAAQRDILRAVEGIQGVRVVTGLASVNLLPAGASNKGTAIGEALTASGCQTVIFVGDDLTDEDAFRTVASLGGIGIRVGRSNASAARYHIDRQRSIDDLLTALINARPSPPGRDVTS
jgi:trehalose 6-phosphate phosphatase